MKVTIQENVTLAKGVVLVTVSEVAKWGAFAAQCNKEMKGVLLKAVNVSKFEGKKGEVISLIMPAGLPYERLYLVGLGKDVGELAAQACGGTIYDILCRDKVKEATVVVEGVKKPLISLVTANIGYGVLLKGYHFKGYKTKAKKEEGQLLQKVVIQCEGHAKAAEGFNRLKAISEGVYLARDFISEPPNMLHPLSYAEGIKKAFSGTKVKVKILGEKEMKALNMGSLLGVGQGSVVESQLVVMEYDGIKDAKKKMAPIALVGKGVTFDTGGISLKPAAGMEDMKYDMGGSAAVVGVLKALALREARVHVVGIVGLVENMPDGKAQRPSDVVTSMSGQTIEVLNTDAEGRLVLADALWYAQEKYQPQVVVDLATLTGAIVISLGSEYAGVFSNDDKLTEALIKAGEETGEKLWRFPLGEAYDKLLNSPIADIRNISSGKGAGSITAAQFLKRFIKQGVAWAHLDIAGVAWNREGSAVCPKGAEGYGVKLLDRWIYATYEKKAK